MNEGRYITEKELDAILEARRIDVGEHVKKLTAEMNEFAKEIQDLISPSPSKKIRHNGKIKIKEG